MSSAFTTIKGFDKMPRGWHLWDNQYYIHYPRNLGNEYTVYVVNRPETVAWCEQKSRATARTPDSTFERITRGHAIYRGIKALREHARQQAAGTTVELLAGGLYGDPVLHGRNYGDILNDSADRLAADTIVCDCGHVTVSDLVDFCEVCGNGEHFKVNRYFWDWCEYATEGAGISGDTKVYVARASDTCAWCEQRGYKRISRQVAVSVLLSEHPAELFGTLDWERGSLSNTPATLLRKEATAYLTISAVRLERLVRGESNG